MRTCVSAVWHIHVVSQYVFVSQPYFPQIFNLSGGWEVRASTLCVRCVTRANATPVYPHEQGVEQYGDWFTYDKTPRALIYARNQSNVRLAAVYVCCVRVRMRGFVIGSKTYV